MRLPQAKKQGISHPYSYSFAYPRQGIKNATGLCYPWRCPGRWPVCIQLYGHGAEAPIDGCCIRILAFRGLSACQGSLNSSKIVVNEMVLTCLKCPWIQCFQGIIRFWLDFSNEKSGRFRSRPHRIFAGSSLCRQLALRAVSLSKKPAIARSGQGGLLTKRVKKQENKAEVWRGNPLVWSLWGWVPGFPLPCGQLFQVHGSKFKLHPVRHLGQASVLRITHAVLFLGIGKHTLYFLLPQLVDVPVLRCVPDVLRHFHKVLPDVAGNRFLTLGALRTHGPCRTVLTQIRPAFVLPVAVPVRCGIVQEAVFGADHIVIEFIVNIGVPGVVPIFGFRARVG